MDFNLHNFLPAVFLKVITVLENGNEPVSWTLSRSGTSQFAHSLSVKSPAIVKDKVNFTPRLQDTGKAVPERSTSKKKKTPGEIGGAGPSGTIRRTLEPVNPSLWNPGH